MKNVMFSLVFAGMMLLGITALADGKYYGGTFCQANSESYISYVRTRSWNISSNDTWFDCAIVKDTNNSVSSAFAWVIDQNPNSNKDVKCTLWCLDSLDSGWFSPEKKSTGSSTNAQQLTFGEVTCSSYRALEMSCLVPGTWNGNQSGVAMYRVDE